MRAVQVETSCFGHKIMLVLQHIEAMLNLTLWACLEIFSEGFFQGDIEFEFLIACLFL